MYEVPNTSNEARQAIANYHTFSLEGFTAVCANCKSVKVNLLESLEIKKLLNMDLTLSSEQIDHRPLLCP